MTMITSSIDQTTTPKSESALRRMAQRHGLVLHKIFERSPHYWEYGPVMLSSAETSGVVARGLEMSEVAAWIEAVA